MPIGPEFRDLVETKQLRLSKVVEVRTGFKNLSIILEMEGSQGLFEALFRPEQGVSVSWDPRIPKPQELYRDCAFHLLDRCLGWSITAPVVPFNSNQVGKGVVRPYWRSATVLQDYEVVPTMVGEDFFMKAAILDFIGGVIDRNHNDILLIDDGSHILIDSGLSFVKGAGFIAQKSIFRERVNGKSIPEYLLNGICLLDRRSLVRALRSYVGPGEVDSCMARMELIKKRECIL